MSAVFSPQYNGGAVFGSQEAAGGTNALAAQSISTGAPTVSTPAIGQVHALSSQSIDTAAPTITAPALTAAAIGDNTVLYPSIYRAISPAQSYAAVSPAQSYAATSH